MLRSKFTLAVIFLFTTLSTVLAQENNSSLIRAKIKHGSLLLGGNIGGNYYVTSQEVDDAGNTINGRTINFIVRAKNGYFIREDVVVGLDMNITHQSTKRTDLADSPPAPNRETLALAGPFARYYMLNGIFGEASALIGLHNFNSVSRKYKAIEGGIGIGYAHFINEMISLEPIVSFRYFQQRDRNGRDYREFGPTFNFGVQVYLLRKKSHVIKRTL